MPERAFHDAMLEIYERAKQDCGYNATRFRQMVLQHGGVETARMLLGSNQPSDGLTALWEHGRLDLSMECLVLRPDFADLFTDEERQKARKTLFNYGYVPPNPGPEHP